MSGGTMDLVTGKYIQGSVTCADEDRISNLPAHLIDSILERLPIQDAVKTGILSKKWRYGWTTMKELVFDQQFIEKFAKNGAFGRNGFIRIINQVLFLHKGPILKFHLDMKNIFYDTLQEVSQWMSFLSRNGVMELILTKSSQRHQLPSHVFSCLELRKLVLHNCFLKRPIEFEGLLNLEDLELKNINVGDNLCGTQISLPQLKKLSLHSCTNVHNFNIKATKLQTLFVVACTDAMLLRLLDSPLRFVIWITYKKPIEDFVQVEKMNLVRLLSNLPRVQHLYMDSHSLKLLAAEQIPKFLPHEISSLEHLRLRSYQLGDLYQLHAVLCLLRNSPNLETLYMRMQEPRVDVGPASNHMESPNCLDCTLNQLHTVKIESLRGSRPELLFIKLLLAHSPSLEKFTIRPSRVSDVQKRLDISKDVMQFPRASTKAKMFYLDPKP